MAALRTLYSLPTGSSHPSSYKDMTYRDVVRLAAVLSHAPPSQLPLTSAQHRSYRAITQDEIAKLPPRLLSLPESNRGKRKAKSSYLKKVEGEEEGKEEEGNELCSLHRPLNDALIESLFRSIKRQLEDKIPAAVDCICRYTQLEADFLQEVDRLTPLNDVPSLWLRPQATARSASDHQHNAKNPPGNNDRFTYQADRCSACILARLGSDPDVLVALLAAMKMHMSEDRTSVAGLSVRISWVQQWIRQFPRRECERMLSVSNQMGDRLKLLHRQARRSEARRAREGSGREDNGMKHDGEEFSNFERSRSTRKSDRNRRYVQRWLDSLVDSDREEENLYELASTSSVYPEDTANATELNVIDQYAR